MSEQWSYVVDDEIRQFFDEQMAGGLWKSKSALTVFMLKEYIHARQTVTPDDAVELRRIADKLERTNATQEAAQ